VITILSWFWRQPGGRVSYEPQHILIWADMVHRHLQQPHRIACVTDEVVDLPGITIIRPPHDFNDIRIPSWPEHRPQCLRRLVMFRPDAARWFGERFVCMDLDCVISAPLDPLFDWSIGFRITRGTARGRPYNGSLMQIAAGARPQVYADFTAGGAAEAGSRFTGSDQAWLAHCLGPHEATWSEPDGVNFHGLSRSPDAPRRIKFFAGSDKPWMRLHDPWISEHYRRGNRGRCLILGYHKSVWRDAAKALETGNFEGVIASPEAAEHWPGPLVAVARDNDEAAQLARMHGFEDLTWCGVREAA
jgi:hypothetical protein